MRIIFCIPGSQFSSTFLKSWTLTLKTLGKRGLDIVLSNAQSNNIYWVRNMCLGGDNLKGKYQLPWQGSVDYDYIMWVDSDMQFHPDQVETLLEKAERNDIDILSGLYRMVGGTYCAVIKSDDDYFKKHGYYEFISNETYNALDKNQLIEASYVGFGFVLIKKGVFEKLGYPWFMPIWKKIKLDNGIVIKDFTGEDTGFCYNAKAAGYTVWVDPSVVVGHEKSEIL